MSSTGHLLISIQRMRPKLGVDGEPKKVVMVLMDWIISPPQRLDVHAFFYCHMKLVHMSPRGTFPMERPVHPVCGTNTWRTSTKTKRIEEWIVQKKKGVGWKVRTCLSDSGWTICCWWLDLQLPIFIWMLLLISSRVLKRHLPLHSRV